MAPQSPIGMLLLWASTAAAWSRTDHWQTTVRSQGTTSLVTSSISVIPTGAVTPISSNVSTTLVTEGGLLANYYTIEVTVTDLFYGDTASGLCTQFASCSPTPTLSTSSSITTEYYAPVAISNPVSCTRTSFAYTTAKSIFLPGVTTAIPNFSEQATQSAQALLITTYVSTLSTNLGGQDVTTSICEVYFREGAVTGVDADTRAHSECVDPRIHDCSVDLARASHFQVFDPSTSVDPSTFAACQTDQKYPPANIGATGTASGASEPTSTSGVSAGFQIKMEWSFGAAGTVALLGFL